MHKCYIINCNPICAGIDYCWHLCWWAWSVGVNNCRHSIFQISVPVYGKYEGNIVVINYAKLTLWMTKSKSRNFPGRQEDTVCTDDKDGMHPFYFLLYCRLMNVHVFFRTTSTDWSTGTSFNLVGLLWVDLQGSKDLFTLPKIARA